MAVLEGKTREAFSDATWEELRRRWREGAYRANFFRDMILIDLARFSPRPTLLEIGCGHSFDGEPAIQPLLAEVAGEYIGIEPDASVRPADCFTQAYRSALEETPLAPSSIDVAVAVFVIEHLPRPQAWFAKVSEILVPGGVFWGFTIDLRHFFALASLAAEGLGAKSWWLKRVGMTASLRGPGYYRAYYRANTPTAVRRCAGPFRTVRLMSLHQDSQFDAYLPRWARPGSRWVNRLAAILGLPGPMLVMRLEK